MKTLFCWLGLTDIKASSNDGIVGLGPIAGALDSMEFDQVTIISNSKADTANNYKQWLSAHFDKSIVIENVTLSDPTNFYDVYEIAERVVGTYFTNSDDDLELVYHLSPGTPTMATVWILLSMIRFRATLIQSSIELGARIVSLPFDIAAEFIPRIMRGPDKDLVTLAEGITPASNDFDAIKHRSPIMERLIARAKIAAIRGVHILIEGPSGVGKELFAKAIHASSPRSKKPFIAVNCGAIPTELFESEFFGYVPGAFTGAKKTGKKGYIEAAHEGTLFLDEIGELPLMSQVRLLRVIQEGKVTPLGATESIDVDIRVVSATNRSLIGEVSEGRFREDLYHRLAIANLIIPPLAERPGDLSLLIDHSIREHNKKLSSQPLYSVKTIKPSARKALMSHSWPGNIRELQNTLLRSMIWTDKNFIDVSDIKENIIPIPRRLSEEHSEPLGGHFKLSDVISEVTSHYLRRALKESGGVKAQAAILLGLSGSQTFINKMKKHGVKDSDRVGDESFNK